jgi:hypothetical protein
MRPRARGFGPGTKLRPPEEGIAGGPSSRFSDEGCLREDNSRSLHLPLICFKGFPVRTKNRPLASLGDEWRGLSGLRFFATGFATGLLNMR